MRDTTRAVLEATAMILAALILFPLVVLGLALLDRRYGLLDQFGH